MGARSSSTRRNGRYHAYLCDEIVPFVDEHYRTMASAAHRGIMGKSSGGFGAMITPMLRPDLFGGLATHAGDGMYECCYVPDFARGCTLPARVRRRHHGVVEGASDTSVIYQGGRSRPRDAPWRLGVLLGARRWDAGAAVRFPDRQAA